MKKVLFNNFVFSGGAPKTMLEYSKIAKKNFDVVAIGEIRNNDKLIKDYYSENIEIIDREAFILKNGIRNIKLLNEYLKYLKEIKPDLIVSTTIMNNFIDSMIHRSTNIPVVYLISGGTLELFLVKAFSKLINKGEVIVLSDELKELMENYLENKIHVIPNRISFSEKDTTFNNKIFDEKADNVKGVLIGRLSEDKIKSVKYIINLTEKLNIAGYPFTLTILGDGDRIQEIAEIAENINTNLDKKVIMLEGYKANVNEFIEKSHIVFGKGRSVLDGVFNNKISIVVNECNESFLIDEKSFILLKKNNITGRNRNNLRDYVLDEKAYSELLSNVLNGDVQLKKLSEINKIVTNNYDISVVEDKIMNIFNNAVGSSQKEIKVNYPKVLSDFLRTYVTILIEFLKNKRTDEIT